MFKGLKKLFAQPSASPSVSLALFGKHPGWDDHIDDLGLDSDLLVRVKQRLYIQGIGGNIDAGSWENLDESQRLEHFDHTFLWVAGDHRVVGRMWASSDGKGRTKYPLIACASAEGQSLDWMIGSALPTVQALEESVRATDSAEHVRAQVDASRQRLIGLAAESSAAGHGPERDAVRDIARFMSPEQRETDMVRIMYQMERELSAYRVPKPGTGGSKTKAADLRPQHMRVPTVHDDAGQSVASWVQFVLNDVAPVVAVLGVCPAGASFTDLFIGDPTAAQFYALRATTQTIPLTSEIPYSIDASFATEARSRIEGAGQ